MISLSYTERISMIRSDNSREWRIDRQTDLA